MFNPGFNLLGIVDACHAADNPEEKALWGFVPEKFMTPLIYEKSIKMVMMTLLYSKPVHNRG